MRIVDGDRYPMDDDHYQMDGDHYQMDGDHYRMDGQIILLFIVHTHTHTHTHIHNTSIFSEGKGCPQGGVLSPILWNIIINDLLNILTYHNILHTAYADDLTLIISAKTTQELVS